VTIWPKLSARRSQVLTAISPQSLQATLFDQNGYRHRSGRATALLQPSRRDRPSRRTVQTSRARSQTSALGQAPCSLSIRAASSARFVVRRQIHLVSAGEGVRRVAEVNSVGPDRRGGLRCGQDTLLLSSRERAQPLFLDGRRCLSGADVRGIGHSDRTQHTPPIVLHRQPMLGKQAARRYMRGGPCHQPIRTISRRPPQRCRFRSHCTSRTSQALAASIRRPWPCVVCARVPVYSDNGCRCRLVAPPRDVAGNRDPLGEAAGVRGAVIGRYDCQ
jgi:hypothetical protein